MRLIFLYGPPASGKLTIARALARRTGFALFHNHLVVDAVGALFSFGAPQFVRLREDMWLRLLGEAADAERSTIFTFAPEPSVAADFPQRLAALIAAKGGRTHFVRLTLDDAVIEQRLANEDRGAFGKLRSLEIWREIREACAAHERTMPAPVLTIDTEQMQPNEAALLIADALDL